MKRLTALVLLALAAPLGAQVPRVLSLQGHLEDPVGAPVSGVLDLTLRLYDQASGGSASHVETDTLVLDPGGVFTTDLGDPGGLAPGALAGPRWVGWTPDEGGGGSELSPRTELLPAPYALHAETSEGLVLVTDLDVGGSALGGLGAPLDPDDGLRSSDVDARVGTLGNLQTSAQGSLVAAVNEVAGEHGDVASLATNDTSSLLAAIAELSGRIDALSTKLAAWTTSPGGTQVYLTGVNLHLRDGSGSSAGAGGTTGGNLFVGYPPLPVLPESRHVLAMGSPELPGTPVELVQRDAPRVEELVVLPGTGDIAFTFELVDWGSADVSVEYRGGSVGSTWTPATIVQSTSDLAPGPNRRLVWDATSDEPALGATDYQLRVTADNGRAGSPATSGVFSRLADSDGDRIPDIHETDTGVYTSLTDTGTDPNDPDTDGDSIPDGDEVYGTLLGLNIPAMGASPLRSTILIEYDWFEHDLGSGGGADGCGFHSHRPTQAIVDRVEATFANSPESNPDGSTGIDILQDWGQGGVFSEGNLIDDTLGNQDGTISGGVSGSEFLTYKAQNFPPERDDYFHWTLMPHRYNDTSGSSGQAEIVGNDLIVSLYCYLSTNNVSNTIVHELGHNLGLRHGGNVNCNYKPQYNSVMNYKYQFPGVDGADCNSIGNGILDYSYGDRLTLDENDLDENQGVCGGVAIDWDDDSVIESSVTTTINPSGDGSSCGGTLTTLTDHDDWAAINYTGIFSLDGDSLEPIEVIDCDNPAPGAP